MITEQEKEAVRDVVAALELLNLKTQIAGNLGIHITLTTMSRLGCRNDLYLVAKAEKRESIR